MAYIGLDIGTTGAKASLILEDGTVRNVVYKEYDLRFPGHGMVEMHPDDVWNAVKDVLAGVAAEFHEPIEAISVASFGEAAVMLDKNGKPIRDSIFYTDVRGTGELDQLRSEMDIDRLQYLTGMPVNYMYTLLKLMWLKKNEPGALEKTDKLLLYGSYIEYMLTGIAATDASLASRTLMFDRFSYDWDEEVCNQYGISRACLPQYVPAGNIIGTVPTSVAKELGLSGKTVVVSGVHDQVAAALGCGALESGQVADGIGSAECITAPLPEKAELGTMFKNNLCAEPHAVKGQHVALAFVNTAGASLKWYRDNFETELKMRCEKDGTNAYDILNQSISEKPSGLLFLPYLAGTGTPYMDGTATGMLTGLTLGTTRQEIYRSIYEGINFEIRRNIELLKNTGFLIPELICGGGGASAEALQLKADVLGIPVWMLENNQVGTMGLAMLCTVAMKRAKDFKEAAQCLVKRRRMIEPNDRFRREYGDKYCEYLRMYDALKLIYAK